MRITERIINEEEVKERFNDMTTEKFKESNKYIGFNYYYDYVDGRFIEN